MQMGMAVPLGVLLLGQNTLKSLHKIEIDSERVSSGVTHTRISQISSLIWKLINC